MVKKRVRNILAYKAYSHKYRESHKESTNRRRTEMRMVRCNCGASCGENRYHNYGDVECWQSVNDQMKNNAKPIPNDPELHELYDVWHRGKG